MRLLKSLALVLVLVNAALWFAAESLRPTASMDAISGRLPRVADLQVARPVTGDSERPVSRQEPEPSRSPAGGEGPPAPPPVAEAPPPESTTDICLQVGWFESEDQARAVIEEQDLIPASARVVEASRSLPAFHWVLLPPADSRAEAYERFQEIRARGIDAYLVMEGEQENAISLGLFESRRAAESVLSQRQEQGLEATLASFPRNQIRYALFFEAAAQGAEDRLQATVERLQNEFESVVKSRCEGVATPQKNP